MLPSRLLDVDVRDGRVVPRWLGPHDEPWLGEMLAAWSTLAGRPASAEDDVRKRILFGIMRRWDVPARTMSLACALERKRWSSRIVAAVPPEKARDVTFELAA